MNIGPVRITPEERLRMTDINQRIPGWSSDVQFLFFKGVLALPEINHVLMLGVYLGRDIAYMKLAKPSITIVGVDRFTDDPCADWMEGQNWKFPPSLTGAWHNISDVSRGVSLVAGDDEVLLADKSSLVNIMAPYDLIYLDTAHDRGTVERQLNQAKPLLRSGGIIGGDDYLPLTETWGVDKAVAASTYSHWLIENCVWYTIKENLR
jgi:hypothetical protein